MNTLYRHSPREEREEQTDMYFIIHFQNMVYTSGNRRAPRKRGDMFSLIVESQRDEGSRKNQIKI